MHRLSTIFLYSGNFFSRQDIFFKLGYQDRDLLRTEIDIGFPEIKFLDFI